MFLIALVCLVCLKKSKHPIKVNQIYTEYCYNCIWNMVTFSSWNVRDHNTINYFKNSVFLLLFIIFRMFDCHDTCPHWTPIATVSTTHSIPNLARDLKLQEKAGPWKNMNLTARRRRLHSSAGRSSFNTWICWYWHRVFFSLAFWLGCLNIIISLSIMMAWHNLL